MSTPFGEMNVAGAVGALLAALLVAPVLGEDTITNVETDGSARTVFGRFEHTTPAEPAPASGLPRALGTIAAVGPFTGDKSEGFDTQTIGDPFPACVEDRVFNDQADLCSTGGCAHITPNWSFDCLISGNNTPRLYGSCIGFSIYTFDMPVARFGGYFGSNAPGPPTATASFYDPDDVLIDTLDITIAPNCGWTWNGWEASGTTISRVEIVGSTFGGAFIDMDDMEIVFAGAAIVVGLDIKPGSCPNSFNRNSNGVLPVALVGTDEFNAADVVISSLSLSRADGVGGSVSPVEGPPGPHTVIADTATPFDGEACDCHALDGDGIADVSVKFKTQDVVAVLQLDGLDPGDLVELCLSGQLSDGTAFEGCDCIRLVGPGGTSGAMAVSSNIPGGSVFFDAFPLDDTLDGGGFTDFVRTYTPGTQVTLTASQFHDNWYFVGWYVQRRAAFSLDPPVYGGLSLDVTVSEGPILIDAIYMRPRDSDSPEAVLSSD